MSEINNHIIRSVSLEITGQDISNAFRLQEEASNWWHNELMPALSKELESYGLTPDIIKISKLEIEINISNKNDWRIAAVKKVIENIKEQLDKHSYETVNISNKLGSNKEEEVTTVKAGSNFISILYTYLNTGIMPWNTSINSKQDMVGKLAEVLNTQEFIANSTNLTSLLKENKTALTRFIRLLDNDILKEDMLYPAIMPDIPVELIKTWSHNVELLINTLPEHKTNIKKASSTIISDVVFAQTEPPTQQDFVTAFKQLVSTIVADNRIKADIIKTIKFEAPFKISSADIKNIKTVASSKQAKTKHTEQLSDSIITDKLTEQDLQNILEKNILEEQGDSTIKNKVIEEIVQEGVYISNAGLVLAAPFLNSLFEHTKLSTDFKITDIDKAVCLAGYIASGKKDLAEFELLLPKILCGVSLDIAIDTSVIIDDVIYSEADDMLRSLIGYWSVLKDTSVEGLRESFLYRDGKLSLKNNEWLLQVAQKAYDMLLQQIPWNYQWIKLPWMTNLLKTEWVG